MLEHRDRSLVVLPAQQHLAEQREALPARAIDFDDAEQLALRFFPLMELRVGTREHDATLEAIGRGLDADVADRDGVLGTA